MKKQKSGLYRTKVRIGVGPDGKPIDKWLSARTRRELEDLKRAVREAYIEGAQRPEDQLFGAYAQKWYARVKASSMAPSGLQSYRTALNHDILPVFGNFNLRAIRPSDLQIFLDGFAGRSRTKITYIRAALRRVFEMACTDRILDVNPMDHIRAPEATPPEEKRPLTKTERQALQKVCREHPMGAYLAVMYYLGVRPGETRGLRWGDFAPGLASVTVCRDIDYKDHGEAGDLKTARSRREIPVPAELRRILDPLRGLPGVYLFRGERSGSAIAKTTAERLWVELMQAAGLVQPAPPNKYRPGDIRSRWAPTITPHTLRHNYVTMCWEAKIDVYTTMHLVGHASIKTTMDIYTHLSDAARELATAEVERMFSGG
jgi:integrase